ncbi:MAG: hypothetical protein ACLSB9_33810 [Hydrogeniiclostridium mannosilyticum]
MPDATSRGFADHELLAASTQIHLDGGVFPSRCAQDMAGARALFAHKQAL